MSKIIGTETVGKGVKLLGAGYDNVWIKQCKKQKYQKQNLGNFYLLHQMHH